MRLERARIDDLTRNVAPTIDELFTDLRDAKVATDDSIVVHVSVAADCGPHAGRTDWTLEALDVRLRTAVVERTQRVALAHAQHVHCR